MVYGGKAVAGETILIIDDNADVRTLLGERVLPGYGYRTLLAPDGQEGLWQIRTHNPDLILLDLRLPDMTGIDLLHILSAEGYDIPVILITAYGSELIAAQALRLGVHDYIIKPFTLDEIVESVERALTTLRLRRERNALTERLRFCTGALEMLAEVPSELARIEEPEQQLCRLLEMLLAAAHAPRGRLWVCGEDGSICLWASQDRGDEHAYLLRQRVDIPPPIETALATSAPQQWESVLEDNLRAIGLALPLVAAGRPLGVLEVYLAAGGALPDDIGPLVARAFAASIGAALERNCLRRQVLVAEQQNEALRILSRDALIVVDDRDTIIAATPTITALSGHRPEELIGMGLRQWLQQVAAPQPSLVDWYRQQADRGQGRYTLVFHGPQGEERLAEVQVLTQDEGGVLRRYLLLHEETAYNRLEQEVRALRRALGEAARGADLGLFLTDLKGTILGVNATASDLVRRAPEEILGQPLWEAFASAQGYNLLPEEIARAYRQGSGYAEVRWAERADQVWRITPLLLLGAGGTPHAIVVLAGPMHAPVAG